MTRRRRPTGDRGTASARPASAEPVSAGSGRARNAAAPEAATRQLPLPLSTDPQVTTPAPIASHPTDGPNLASARVLPHAPVVASVSPGVDARHVATETQQPSASACHVAHEERRPDAAMGHAMGHAMGEARPPRLSGPREGRPALHAHLDDVRSALAEGWEIVQPIFARPLWSVSDDSATAFNFVLRREAATRLVTVPEGRGVQRFIRDHHLAVDYRA